MGFIKFGDRKWRLNALATTLFAQVQARVAAERQLHIWPTMTI